MSARSAHPRLPRLAADRCMQCSAALTPGLRRTRARRLWKERPVPAWAQSAHGGPVSARVLDLRMGRGDEHDGCKPRGCAVVLDPRLLSLAPLWNEEILDPDFPRWQDGSTIDEEEYRRCGQAGYAHVHARETPWLFLCARTSEQKEEKGFCVQGGGAVRKRTTPRHRCVWFAHATTTATARARLRVCIY